MKKIISFGLVLIMVLSLCACGGGGEKQNESPNEQNSNITNTESEQKNLHLNETVELGNFEFTITDVEFVKEYSTSAANTEYDTGHRAAGNYVYLRVDYSVKNISKGSVMTPLSCMQVDYNDGYVFTPYRSYQGNISGTGGVETASEMKPLSSAVSCRTYIEIPEEAQISDNDLYVKIYLSYGEQPDAVYAVRPLDEMQKEALYQQGIEFLNEGTAISCKYAMARFSELGEYKDCAELLKTATEKRSVLAGDTDYLLENKDKYQILTGAEISSIIVGEWMFSWEGMQQWSFLADGTLDDHAGHDRTWKVDGDKLLITTKNTTWNCEMRRVYDGGYFIIYEQEISGQMKTVAKTMYPME